MPAGFPNIRYDPTNDPRYPRAVPQSSKSAKPESSTKSSSSFASALFGKKKDNHIVDTDAKSLADSDSTTSSRRSLLERVGR